MPTRKSDYDDGSVDLSMVDTQQLIEELQHRNDQCVVLMRRILQENGKMVVSDPRFYFYGDKLATIGLLSHASFVANMVLYNSAIPQNRENNDGEHSEDDRD